MIRAFSLWLYKKVHWRRVLSVRLYIEHRRGLARLYSEAPSAVPGADVHPRAEADGAVEALDALGLLK